MLLRQTRLYLPAQIVAPLVLLLSILVWAHLLPADELGKVALVVTLADVLFALCFVWWSHFVLRHLPGLLRAGDGERFRRMETVVLAACVLVQLTILCLFSLFYFTASGWMFHCAAAVHVSLKTLAAYWGDRARAEGKVFTYSALQAALPACGLILSIFALRIFGPHAEIALFFAALPLAAGVIFVLRGRIGAGRWDGKIARDAWAFGLPAMAAALFSALALNVPRFAVDLWLGHAAAGAFSVAFGLGFRAPAFAVMLVTAGAYPLAVQRIEQEGRAAGFRQLSANMLLVYAVCVPVALGLAGIAGSVSQLLLPLSMQEKGTLVISLASIAGLLRYLRAHTTDQVFLLASATRPIAIIAGCELAMTLLFCVAAIDMLGAVGGAAGLLGATLISAAASAIWSRSRFGFSLPASALFRIVLAGLLMTAAVHFLGRAESLFALAIRIALGVFLYLLLLGIFFPGMVATTARFWSRAVTAGKEKVS